MLADACTKAVIGLSALVDAISCLDAELKATQQLVKTLETRLAMLEDRDFGESDLKERIDLLLETNTFDSLVEDKVRDAVDSIIDEKIEDAIDSALSGREVDVNISGTITL